MPLTLTYDALGRVEQEVNAVGTFGYTYDGISGRLATVTYPNNQTSAYSYFPTTQDHRLQTIAHRYPNGAILSQFDYTYDAVGNIVTWRQQADTTAVIWEYGHDNADQLIPAVKRATDPQGTILQRFAYGFDPAGNRLFEQIDDSVTAWTYDRLNRLVTQQAGGLLRVAGTTNEPAMVRIDGRPAALDASSVFVGGVQVAPGTTRFTVTATDGAGNAATQQYDVDQAGPAKVFTFDANGNLTSDGTRTFEWDARNQLVALNAGTRRSEFGYDGLQRRVREIEKENGTTQSDTRVVWCGADICEERNADGVTVTRRALPHGEQIGSAARFFAADHLGSVTEVTDETSGVLARYAFDPWGRRTLIAGSNISSVGFTGHRSHTISQRWLTLYRTYDPDLGRWSSDDPFGLIDGPNLFAYVANRPITYMDLFGTDATNWNNTTGGRSRWNGPTNGNWGGRCWSGGRYSCGDNPMGDAPPTDSGDACYMRHDRCYDRCGGNERCIAACDRRLVEELDALPDDPRRWPEPPRPGTEGDTRRYRDNARRYFR